MVDTFHNLTEEKLIRIYKLPYELLAIQEGKKLGLDIKVDMTVKKKEDVEIS
ncbi:MAG: hypothetical protein K2J04_08915 [Lachnospiraceae bacterium]|nr:hypothetical protein [Lachnospiraceae bacterium]